MDRNAPLCSAWLARLRRDYPGYASIRADSISGRVFCSSDPGQAGFDGDAPYFQAALDHGFAVGSDSLSRSGRPELPLGLRITDYDGAALGVLVIGLDLVWLAQNLPSQLPADATVTVLDNTGSTLVSLPATRLAPDPSGVDRGPMLQSSVTLGNGLKVIAERPQRSAFAVLDRTTRGGAILIAAALLLVCIFADWFGRRFIRAPVNRMLATTDKLHRGDFSARTGFSSDRSELAKLGAGLDALAEELESRQNAQYDTERQLRELATTLEMRVAERTRALVDANQRLMEETEQRQQIQTELSQAQKLDALGRLTGGVAHDFNNLLTAVLGSLDIVSRRVQDPRLIRLLDIAVQAARRGAELTARMLAFSRKQELVLRPVDINASISGMRDLLTRTLGKMVRLEYDLAEDLWHATADSVQLEVALLNLAINARDAMPSGGSLTFRTRNIQAEEGPHSVAALTPGDYAMVAVLDTGEGMPPEVQSKVFDPFFTTKGVGKGTGLGLSMVYGFTRQVGGSVTIDSSPGKGTAIGLYLPRAAIDAETAVAEPVEDEPMAPLSLLLVDDDDMAREGIAAMLCELGHRVVEAADGASALNVLRESATFDIALADFAMPGMNGVRFAAELRTFRPNLPVLLVTGYTDRDALDGWLQQGGRTLSKPFSRAELARELRMCLGISGLA
jgi:signal transduction histidine kinase